MYELAADITLIVHFAFIIFVVFGGILFLISTKIIYAHVPALIWGIYIELTHSVCPLTYLENWFEWQYIYPILWNLINKIFNQK